jgi:hypothetical protein
MTETTFWMWGRKIFLLLKVHRQCRLVLVEVPLKEGKALGKRYRVKNFLTAERFLTS